MAPIRIRRPISVPRSDQPWRVGCQSSSRWSARPAIHRVSRPRRLPSPQQGPRCARPTPEPPGGPWHWSAKKGRHDSDLRSSCGWTAPRTNNRCAKPKPAKQARPASARRCPMTESMQRDPSVVAVGVDLLADAIETQAAPVDRVDWQPPMPGTETDLATVAGDPRRRDANAEAVRRMLDVRAHLVDVVPAREALGLGPGDFLHAGPPITWDRASGPMRGALMGACAFEGLVDDPERAALMLASGSELSLEPCHHHGAVGPMAGIVSPSMWMFVLEDPVSLRRTYCSLNEGLGKVLRYGAYSPDVIDRLRWMASTLGPLLQTAVRAAGPVDMP